MSMPNELSTLPKNVLYEILIHLSPEQLKSACQSNQQLAEICHSAEFWNYKYYIRFGEPTENENPKFAYYQKEKEELQFSAAAAIVRLKDRVYDLIISSLLQPIITEDEEIANRLAHHISSKLFGELISCRKLKSPIYCFNDFNWNVRTFLMRLQPDQTIRRPRPNIPVGKVKLSPSRNPSTLPFLITPFISHIDPQAAIFKQYDIQKHYDELLTALNSALFDVISELLDELNRGVVKVNLLNRYLTRN